MGKVGEIGPEGRAVCYYLEGGGEATPIGKIGIGKGTTNKTAYLDLRAEIRGALEEVTAEEARATGDRPMVNLVLRRWIFYLLMVKTRNALKTHRKRARNALDQLPSPWAHEKLREHEEAIIQETEALLKYERENNRLRKDKLYLRLMEVFAESLRSRGVRV